MRNLHDSGAVVQQIVAIRFERLTQSLLKNRATKAGAVDDEVDGVLALAAQRERFDESALVEIDGVHIVQDVFHTAARGDVFQERGELRGVEMIGVANLAAELRRAGTARREIVTDDLRHRRKGAHIGEAGIRRGARRVECDEIVGELAAIDRAGRVEDIQELDRLALVVVVPVDEMRRDFEGRIR